MQAMQKKYAGFHQQMLTADGNALAFYKSLGFSRAGKTEPMWIYAAVNMMPNHDSNGPCGIGVAIEGKSNVESRKRKNCTPLTDS